MSRDLSRRQFLAGAAATGVGLALGCSRSTLDAPDSTGASADAGFDHVIVVMMENRSFDHLLGWAPNADGRQAGLTYVDTAGVAHQTYPLAPDFQGCAHPDPDHSYQGGRIQFNGGACDGFLKSGSDVFAIGYYQSGDLDFLGRAVPDWTIGDRYFCSALGPTVPNRLYLHAGQTDRITNTAVESQLPTIWDRLAGANLAGRYYYGDSAFTGLWGTKYQAITHTIDAFYSDAATGSLPNLAFVDPLTNGELPGVTNDDHPHADIRAGEHFMHEIYTAVTTSPAWNRAVLVFTFDEWGGFFEHVPPPVGAVSPVDIAAGNVDGRLGFRVPLVVVSPFARAGHVAHDVFDHTSILKMVEARWRLPALAARDASANSLASVLDFAQEPRTAPQYPTPPVTIGAPC